MNIKTRCVLTIGAVIAVTMPAQAAVSAAIPGGSERAAVVATSVEVPEGSAESAAPTTGTRPGEIQAAYGLKGLDPDGRMVVVASPYGYPQLDTDLALFRSSNHLPPCTRANGCLHVVNENGGGDLPPGDPECSELPNECFAFAQALTLDAISAACPACSITVVQSLNYVSDFDTAVDTAAAQPDAAAVVVVGIQGDSAERPAYNHPGVAIIAASNNGCCGASYPAGDGHVVAVGGTSLRRTGRQSFTETAYTGAGSGCSRYVFQPRWQRAIDTGCSGKRALTDVAAAADPDAGGILVANNDSFHLAGGGAEATGIIGAVFALAGHTKGYPAKRLYGARAVGHLHDITTGSNGSCGAPLCDAQPGWDGPTGMGTPKGIKAF